MFRPPEGFPTWTLLLPSENISKAVIADKVDVSALSTSPDPGATSSTRHGGPDSQEGQAWPEGGELLPGGDPSGSEPRGVGVGPPAGDADSSAQSSVTYATVLAGPKQQQQPLHLHDKYGGGSSSSDEGNFSANNSDISGSFPGGLWDLDAPRRSCSYNSMEELSETSEHSDREVGEEKVLYYLGMDHGDDEESEEEEEPKAKLIQNVALNREGASAESFPLLQPTDSTCDFPPLYLPQFRTGPSSVRQLSAQLQDGRRQL